MTEYEKRGYLHQNYRIFHPIDYDHREFSFHYHDFYKILILLKGDITYCIEGKSYQLSPYDIVLINAGEVHRPIVHNDSTYERIILYVSPDFLRSFCQDTEDLGLCFSRAEQEQSNVLRIPGLKSSKLYRTLRELEEALHDMEYAGILYRDALFLEFMVHLNRAAFHNIAYFQMSDEANPKILSVLSYINEHLTEEISVDLLSETFFISRYHLMHSFKQETGYTIGSYLSLKRLLYARDLISQDMPVTQACFACGFRNYSTFSRAYKKQFGAAPTAKMS